MAGMLHDDVPASDAIDLIDDVERGKAFKPRGRGLSPFQKILIQYLEQIEVKAGHVTFTAADAWWHLKVNTDRDWSFEGDPAGTLCEVWYKDKPVCSSFQSFQTALSKAKSRY